MNRAGISCVVLFLVVTFSGTIVSAQTSCPSSADEWTAWRDATIDKMLTPQAECADFGVHDGDKANFCTRSRHREEMYLCRRAVADVGADALATIEQCNPSETIRSEILQNISDFSAAVGKQFEPGHTRGFKLSDAEYIKYAGDAIAFPELLSSQEFLQKIGDPARYHEALEMINARNKSVADQDGERQWTTLLYEAPFLPSPDCKTYGQFAVYVPGEIDKFIQFGILTPEQIATETEQLNGVSIVSLKPTGLPPPNINEVFIVDYWRQYEAGKVELSPKIEATGESTNCYACHKAAVMPFYPTRGFTFNSAGNMIESDPKDIERIRAYIDSQESYAGPPYFGEQMTPAYFGPALGPAERYRSDEFLTSCTSQWPDVDIYKIAGLMGCSECHNADLMGAINFPQAVPSDRDAHGTGGLSAMPWATLTFVEAFVQLGYMPPGLPAPLSPDEKSALSNCLLKEYYDPTSKTGLFYDWLRNEAG